MMKKRTMMQSSRVLSMHVLVGAAMLLLLVAAPAIGQDALGRGDALDANLDPRTGGRNLPIDQPDFRRRNLVITGDVAGGRGFRGEVDYRAPGDFAGELATDDLFAFRARAAQPMPRAMFPGEVRDPFQLGRDLRVQEYRRSVGAMPGRLPDRAPMFRGDIPEAAQISRQRMAPLQLADEALMGELPIDRWTTDAMAGRALDSRIEPRTAGFAYDPEGQLVFFTTSPVRGIEQVAAQDRLAMEGLTTYDRIRLREDYLEDRMRGPVGDPFERRFELLVADEEFRAPDAVFERDRVTGRTDYVQLLERIARRYADDPRVRVAIDASLLHELDEQFDDLREKLMGMRERGIVAEEEAESAIDEIERRLDPDFDPDSEEEDPRDLRDEMLPDVPQPDDPSERRTRPRDVHDDRDARRDLIDPVDPPDFGEIADVLRHGQRLDRLASEEGDSRFDELLRAGERSLAAGEFFTAEQRFRRAMRVTPDHPMARIGISHAQLGAELDRTAAQSLQRLLSAHPELIDVRYGRNLLPGQQYLTDTIDRLQRNVRDGRDIASSGFLLAYLGHQLDNRELVERGLSAFTEDRSDDPLGQLLRAVWLEAPDRATNEADKNAPQRQRGSGEAVPQK